MIKKINKVFAGLFFCTILIFGTFVNAGELNIVTSFPKDLSGQFKAAFEKKIQILQLM